MGAMLPILELTLLPKTRGSMLPKMCQKSPWETGRRRTGGSRGSGVDDEAVFEATRC
jgi:hypothetical protein